MASTLHLWKSWVKASPRFCQWESSEPVFNRPRALEEGKASELSHLLSSDGMVSIFSEPMWAFEVAHSSCRGNTGQRYRVAVTWCVDSCILFSNL